MHLHPGGGGSRACRERTPTDLSWWSCSSHLCIHSSFIAAPRGQQPVPVSRVPGTWVTRVKRSNVRPRSMYSVLVVLSCPQQDVMARGEREEPRRRRSPAGLCDSRAGVSKSSEAEIHPGFLSNQAEITLRGTEGSQVKALPIRLERKPGPGGPGLGTPALESLAPVSSSRPGRVNAAPLKDRLTTFLDWTVSTDRYESRGPASHAEPSWLHKGSTDTRLSGQCITQLRLKV